MGGFGISMGDDGSIRRALTAVAPIQQRNYVIMEVKSNLLQADRKLMFGRWPKSGFRISAYVMMGQPPASFAKKAQEVILVQKQADADKRWFERKAIEQKKIDADKAKKKAEKAKKKAEKA